MVAPLVGIAAGVAARAVIKKIASNAIKSAATKKLVKEAAKKKALATPKSAVKVLPRKTAPKTDLSSRGAKPTRLERSERASDLRFNKAEKNYEQRFDTSAGGPRAGGSSSGNPGKKNLRKEAAIKKEAKPVVKINSAVKSKTADQARSNSKALKAANKPLSKGNKKLVTQIKQQTGYIAMDRRPTPPTVAAALKKGPKGSFILEAKKIAMQEARSMSGAKKISPAQKALNKKKK